LSEDAFNHIEDLLFIISAVQVPFCKDFARFVLLSGDRLYTVGHKTLYIYSMMDHTFPIATYVLPDSCHSGLIADNFLFLGGENFNGIIVYELSASLTEPLK
jgi:hypothetical protein